jgi:phage protein D
MDVNQFPVIPSARRIVGRCLLNGVEVPFVSFEVDNNAFNSADTYSVSFGTSALPQDMGLLNWWAHQTSIKVELHVGIYSKLGVDWTQLMVGYADAFRFNPARTEITLDGRDFTALLIDAKSAGESFKNYTSSQIATLLAKRHGLTPVVTATTKRFGEFYQIDTAHLTGEQTEWDLLCALAAIEMMQVYVSGNELHFEPQVDPATTDQYLIKWVPPGTLAYPQANVSDDLLFERALTVTKGVTVEVLSWHSRHKRLVPFVAAYPKYTKGTTPGQSAPRTQVYRIIRNGLTPDMAMQKAQAIYKQIVQHEMKMSGSSAGDNLLTPQTIIRVEGTESPFDQLYFCDSVRRSFSWEGGYRMSFSAKNHSPLMQVSG